MSDMLISTMKTNRKNYKKVNDDSSETDYKYIDYVDPRIFNWLHKQQCFKQRRKVCAWV